MSIDLVLDHDIDTIGQFVEDQDGHPSALSLTNDKVGIGTVNPVRRLDVFGNGTVTGAIAAANAAGTQRVNIWTEDQLGHIDSGGSGQVALAINMGGGTNC